MPLVLLVMTQCLAFTALSAHGSADPAVSPTSNSLSHDRKKHGTVAAAPPNKEFHILQSMEHSPTEAHHPHHRVRLSNIAVPPFSLPFKHQAKKHVHGSASSPTTSFYRHHHARNKFRNSASSPSYLLSPHPYSQQGPSVSSFHSPVPSSTSWGSPSPAPSPAPLSRQINMRFHPPAVAPLGSSLKNMKTPPPPLVWTLPPPPPNEDCASLTCTEPLTYTPPGSPCGCVWPIQVKLRLSVALYTFFPLVSELADEIAAGVSLNHSQVRIMGANAANQQLDKTIILIDLVPLGEKFNHTTAFSIYEKFWLKKVFIKTSLYGGYEALYVRYPGLPPSPPSSIGNIDDGSYSGHGNNGRVMKPLGVDVPQKQKHGLGGSMITVIVLSSVTGFVICIGVAWVLVLKCRGHVHQAEDIPHSLISSFAKPSGAAGSMMLGSRTSSTSVSFSSGVVTYTGSAKTFSLNDIERATDNFDASRVLGEGGFGLVYRGILDDGVEVAVKVLKRDDQQGGREFLAEVEMLSRLHHRNLVKLIGICTEEHTRCLVYELVPNGSVESHLHGVDKEASPLDWGARMKIALGAARGLAYLHEDSSPRVIHRDFKSSNILLEHDFTPKVSDFGLARTALDEGNKHISTRVMGTFGYLAPEYAMTGHLLVKSDVYSYGVVLLELLTGRKPVDLSQPPGQENLVAWARPLLTTKEGLETIIDPALKSSSPFDSAAKVAAIASMCVQPEVSHRPFMGEVVQALKLVCSEYDETKDLASKSFSQENLSIDVIRKSSRVLGELLEVSQVHHPVAGYDSSFDTKMALSVSDLVSTSMGFEGQDSGSFRRYSSSGPLSTGRRREFWQRLRRSSGGSASEHGFSFKLWPRSS
ncbi:Receptor-like serine/threonine-protein kinase ALE2 [Vitis vinifera]|uniref:Receptor-like serine/threonine-protein kinase ALE2 n=1 Tax=Vitis vinifera TaxID=29760 RepID=A0A438K6M5_VITVI|nr:Receptor-like serine/threonine-protein kinase ALE2 [Vitis vinifera]